MKTIQAFIKFVISADEAIALDHYDGFDKCAVGKFSRSFAHTQTPEVLYNQMHQEVLQQIKANTDQSKLQQALTAQQLLKDLSTNWTMRCYAPSMGALVKYMDAQYPLVRSLVNA